MRIQARVSDIILGENQLTYSERLANLDMISLERRRWIQTSNFAVKLSKDPAFQFLFPLKRYTGTRSKDKYQEYKTNTRRFQVSPIVSYVKIINYLESQK